MPHTGATHTPPPPFLSTGAPAGYATPVEIVEATFQNPKFRGIGSSNGLVPTDGLIQRGYMRLLTEVFEFQNTTNPVNDVRSSLNHDLGTKLNFQFNPNELTRSVVARTDTQLWINQSPSQLLQPGIGDMSFSWQMLFNREAEVQKGRVFGNRDASAFETDSITNRLDEFSTQQQASADTAAEELGVLADIAILDRITGQSISKEAIQYAQDRYARLVASGDITEEEEEDDKTNISALAGGDVASLMDINVQNSAFLIPNPIRVVFSENFMVDGYVNSVTVSFKKFSTQMVPTVALVDVSMHAIYQGFARYKSTFTTILELAQKEKKEEDGTIPPADPGTGAAKVQDAGRVSAVLDGIDHSPTQDLRFTADRIPKDPETKLEHHKYASTDNLTVDEQDAKPFKIDGGISFAIISRLGVGPDGGGDKTLLTMHDNDELVVSDLSARVSMGLRLRARLRPIQQSGGITPKAMLEALIAEDVVDEPVGLAPGYIRDSVFFAMWPEGQRKLLLAQGDGMDSQLGSSATVHQLFSEFDGQTVSTRSFPITHHANGTILPNDTYGDMLGIHEAVYPKGDVYVGDSGGPAVKTFVDKGVWIWLNWRDAYDDERKWEEDDTLYYLAKGFYSPSDTSSFPSELIITHSDTTKNLVFEVDYQMNLLFRTQLAYQGNEVTDTGWLRVHPRSEVSAFIPDSSGQHGPGKNLDLNGDLVGNKAVGLGLDARFPWQYDQRGTKLHFDGHKGFGGNTIPWSYQNTSSVMLGIDYSVGSVSVYISSDPDKTQGYVAGGRKAH